MASTRVWYEFTRRSDGMVRRRTYVGVWRGGRWRFRGVGSFVCLEDAEAALRKMDDA